MTILTTGSSISYIGNGAATVWNYSFTVLDADTVVVTVFNSVTQTTTTIPAAAYTLTGVGGSGGTVTYPLTGAPLSATQRITIQRIVPLTQPTSFTNQDGYYPHVLEHALDAIVMQTQQENNSSNRGLKVPPEDNTVPAALPPIAQRANQMLGFDAAGNPVAVQPAGAAVSSFMATVVSAGNQSDAQATLGLKYSADIVAGSDGEAVLSPTGVAADTYAFPQSLTVDEKGRVTEVIGKAVTGPTVTKLTSGSGTYTVPAGALRLTIRMIGGGGGGGGNGTGTSGGTGGTGGTTTFNSITAVGGSGGNANNSSLPGDGGAGGTGGTGAAALRLAGGSGQIGAGPWLAQVYGPSGNMAGSGAASPFGGAGGASIVNTAGRINAVANTGAGAAGATSSASGVASGSGGGAGEYVELILTGALAASYAYTIGAGGIAGTAGTAGAAGGVGGAGAIYITEWYS